MPTTLATSELPPFSLPPFLPLSLCPPCYLFHTPKSRASLHLEDTSTLADKGCGQWRNRKGQRESYSDCCFLSAYFAVLCVKLMRMFCQLHATPQSNRQQHVRRERESEKGGERGERVCWQHPPVRRRMMMMMPTAMALSCAQRQRDTIVLTGRRLKIKQSIIKNRKQIVQM